MAVQITKEMQNQIAQNYIAILGRNPDPAGFNFWVQTYADANGTPQALTSITNGFGNSQEFRDTYAGKSTQDAVALLYNNVLLRNADAGGLKFWSDYANKLIASGQTISNAYAQTGAQIIYNASSQGMSDAAGINARTATAVTSGTSAPTNTYTLTTSTETLNGTSGNDNYNGLIQDAGVTGTTVNPGDIINGNGGIDSLTISVAGNPGAFTLSAIQTNSIEKVLLSNFDNIDANAVTVDTIQMTGLTTVGLSASNAFGDSAFSGMKNFVAAEMRNGAGDLTLNYNGSQVVSGTADSQALTVSGLTAGGFVANGIETIAITSESVKSTLASVASDALKTVTVTGAVDLTITAALNFASNGTAAAPGAVVNASAFTGKLAITTTNGEVLSLTGGSGDDTFTLGSLTKDDTIVGGAGNDTINMAAATLTNQFTKVSGVEKVAFIAGVADVAMDVSKLSAGVTTVQMDLSDGTDGGAANITGTISNLSGQTVNLKHTVANAADTDGSDGTAYTITNATDTTTDTINITLDAIGVTSTANNATSDFGIDVLNVSNFETVNLQSKKSTTVTANEVRSITDTLTKTINVTGDADLTITNTGSALTALNASALDGKLNVTFGANKVTATGGAKDDTFIFAGNLNNDDSVVGGDGKDTVTATVTGLTATTGALKIAGVETITLDTTGANTLALAGVTDATQLTVSNNAQTITGLNLATKIVMTDDASLDVTAANATGANDTLTVERRMLANADETNTVKAGSSIENLAIILNDQEATAGNKTTYTLTNLEAQKITVTESASTLASASVDLGTLNKSVTSVDTSGVKGTQAFSVANTLTAATLNLSGAAVATVTGTGVNDTINVSSTGAVTHVIDAGAGTGDVVNITVGTGFINIGSITNAETMNVTVAAGNSISLTGGGSASFATSARAVNILGGNAASTFTTGNVVTEVTSVNASGFGGNLLATFAADVFDSTVTVTGSSLTTDQITASYATAATYAVKTTGVEILALSVSNAGNTAASYTVDLSGTTGVSRVNATVAAADTLVIDKATNQTVRVVGMLTGDNVSTVEYKLADATGSADSVTFDLLASADANSIADGSILKTTDIETINLKASSAESISLANLAMTDATKFMSLVVSGDKALTVSALNANVTSINASGMITGGSFVQTGRSQTTAANYVGSLGNDAFIMAHGNDVIDGAAGTGDTLSITGNYILGGIQIDLNASGDQITTFNGAANAAIQTGFENIDLSAITGTAAADITANKGGSIITGTANADQILGGAGNDTFVVNAGTVANSDVMDGAGGTDILQIATGLTYTQATDASLVRVETINLIGTASVVLTGQTEAFTINGGTGASNITGGTGNDTIVLVADTAIDTINVRTTTGSETITGFEVGAGGDVINGGISSGGNAVNIVTSADATTALVVAGTDEVIVLRAADNATFADLAAVKTRLLAGTESFAASDSYYVVFNNAAGVTSIAILTTTATANTTLDADENLVLVATLTGITSPVTLLAANFATLA